MSKFIWVNVFKSLEIMVKLFIGEHKHDDLQTSTNQNSQLLENLGYKVGSKIGFGSYSTVRVRNLFL